MALCLWLVARYTSMGAEYSVVVRGVHRTCLVAAEVDHALHKAHDLRHIWHSAARCFPVRDTTPALRCWPRRSALLQAAPMTARGRSAASGARASTPTTRHPRASPRARARERFTTSPSPANRPSRSPGVSASPAARPTRRP